MRLPLPLLALMVTACGGMDESEFVAAYTDSWCEHLITCSNSAELTFEGITSVETCRPYVEPEVGLWGRGCKYRPSAAAECLDAVALVTCPAAEGTLAERPSACDFVYTACQAISDPEPEQPADTDT